MAQNLKIGEVARRAGVRIDTVRFYERLGILPPASRAPSGYRFFEPATVDRILFVKKAQALGFTLDETTEILRSIDRGEASYADGRSRLERVLARIDDKLAELRAVRREVVAVLERFVTGHCDEIESTAQRIKRPTRR
jgi:MerR family mercuric resistance operon transcriptional regulator